MKTIDIDETVRDLVPPEFLGLPADLDYRLTKLEDRRDFSMVSTGDFVKGHLSIVQVIGLPGVRVCGQRLTDYIRTSPIVKVIDTDEGSIKFQTEGGVYLLEILL